MVQIKKNIWEIDEFDLASIFLIIGSERAMMIDCGMGVGDLKGAVEMLTDKPLTVVISHSHPDHTGNARQFREIWMNPKDKNDSIPFELKRRREDTWCVALRQGGNYPYDIDTDLREPTEPVPVIHDLTDGQEFDLGDRIIRAYECPGHTKGEMVFLDATDRMLFAGDALNYNLQLRQEPIETDVRYLEKIKDMKNQYDGIWNGHHDFRPLGAPLGEDCLDNVIDLCHQLLDGTYSPVTVKSFWGPWSGRPDVTMICKGKNYLGWNPELIYDKDAE